MLKPERYHIWKFRPFQLTSHHFVSNRSRIQVHIYSPLSQVILRAFCHILRSLWPLHFFLFDSKLAENQALYSCFAMSESSTSKEHQNHGILLVAPLWAMTAVSILVIGLRCYGRKLLRNFGWDDYVMIFTVVSFTFLSLLLPTSRRRFIWRIRLTKMRHSNRIGLIYFTFCFSNIRREVWTWPTSGVLGSTPGVDGH